MPTDFPTDRITYNPPLPIQSAGHVPSGIGGEVLDCTQDYNLSSPEAAAFGVTLGSHSALGDLFTHVNPGLLISQPAWGVSNGPFTSVMFIGINTFDPSYHGYFLVIDNPNPSTPYYYYKNDGHPESPVGEYIGTPWGGNLVVPGQLIHVTAVPIAV